MFLTSWTMQPIWDLVFSLVDSYYRTAEHSVSSWISLADTGRDTLTPSIQANVSAISAEAHLSIRLKAHMITTPWSSRTTAESYQCWYVGSLCQQHGVASKIKNPDGS
jgi:hypothetical protein